MKDTDIQYLIYRIKTLEKEVSAIYSSLGLLRSFMDNLQETPYALATHNHSCPTNSPMSDKADGTALAVYVSGVTHRATLIVNPFHSGPNIEDNSVPLFICNPSTSAPASAININSRWNPTTNSLQFYAIWRDFPQQ